MFNASLYHHRPPPIVNQRRARIVIGLAEGALVAPGASKPSVRRGLPLWWTTGVGIGRWLPLSRAGCRRESSDRSVSRAGRGGAWIVAQRPTADEIRAAGLEYVH